MSKPTKPTLLFLHGFRGDHHGLRFIAEQLEQDYHVLLPDLPPFGHTKALLAKHDIETYSRWLKDYIDTKSPDQKPILVAHSMGSIVASYYATKYPETIDSRIVLISPISRTPAKRKLSRAMNRATRVALHPLTEKATKRVLASKPVTFAIYKYMTSSKDKATKQLIRDEHYQYSGRFDTAQAFLDSMEMSMTRDCLEFAADLRDHMVCIIAGAKDQLTSTKTTRKLTRAIGTDLNLLDGTGHLIVYEQPNQVADIIRRFLSIPTK